MRQHFARRVGVDFIAGQHLQKRREALRRDGLRGELHFSFFDGRKQLCGQPVHGCARRDSPDDQRFEIHGDFGIFAQKRGFLAGKTVLHHEAPGACGRHFRKTHTHFFNPFRRQFDDRHHRVGHARAFKLAAHREGDFLFRVPQAGVQDHRLARLHRLTLAADLVSDRIAHVADGVHVFDFHLRIHLAGAFGTHGNIGIHAHRAVFHAALG